MQPLLLLLLLLFLLLLLVATMMAIAFLGMAAAGLKLESCLQRPAPSYCL
jgi:hypothetical protein